MRLININFHLYGGSSFFYNLLLLRRSLEQASPLYTLVKYVKHIYSKEKQTTT